MNSPERPPKNQSRSGDDGFALVVVLGFLLLVASVLTAFTSSARVINLQSKNSLIETQLRMAAQATSRDIIEQYLSLSTTSQTGASVGFFEPTSCEFGRLKLNLIAQEHSGLIDLNAANGELLKLGFLSLGFDLTQSAENAAKTQRFRKGVAPESPRLPAEANYKNASFEHVVELYEIESIDQVKLSELLQVFTVHSRRGVVSLGNLSPRLETATTSGMLSTDLEMADTSPSGVISIDMWLESPRSGLKYYGTVFRINAGDKTSQILEFADNKVTGTASLPAAADWSSSNCRLFFNNGIAELLGASVG